MSVITEMTMRTKVGTFVLFVFCALVWADIANEIGKKVEVKSTALKFIDIGYVGRDPTRNYFYLLDNGVKIRAPDNNKENSFFLTEYLRQDFKCDVVYFENDSLINNDINVANSIRCGDDERYLYND
ncbi:hypothetical protein [Vibrio neptunius]|uniref:hypothetical protein n=1 Tax=Vibrio neptunius TaxID=170651 RepID=UPI0039EAC2BA